MTAGVFLADLSACGHAQAGGTFLPLPKLATEPFLKLWEQEVFALLLAEGKITKEATANMRSWKHSGLAWTRACGWSLATRKACSASSSIFSVVPSARPG